MMILTEVRWLKISEFLLVFYHSTLLATGFMIKVKYLLNLIQINLNFTILRKIIY